MAAEPAPARGPEDPDVLIERERRARPRAAIAAAVAAALLFASQVLSQRLGVDFPDKEPAQLLYLDDHGIEYVASAVLGGLGFLALGAVLIVLYQATRGRRPQLPPVARACAIGGPILLFVANIAARSVLVGKAHTFATTGAQLSARAHDVFRATELQIPLYLGLAGSLVTGFAVVIICLNALRAGLLTRYIGIMGIAFGVLLVIPLGPLPLIVQTLWLGTLAVLLAGRWRSGLPPAWKLGEAVPWPSQQELRERAQSAREEPVDAEPAPAAATAGAPAAARKRKRKRRR